MRLRRPIVLLLILGWLLLVLYPDPSLLLRSVNNVKQPDIDTAAVHDLAASLPDDPRLIEQAVLRSVVPYAYDWEAYGVPWYFPTTGEALAAGRGDCESRAVILASILKAKGIPHQILMSFNHIWVQYEGKAPTALENPDIVLAQRIGGKYRWGWPANLDLRREMQAQLDSYWTPMPGERRVLLFAGPLLLLIANSMLPAHRDRRFEVAGGIPKFARRMLETRHCDPAA